MSKVYTVIAVYEDNLQRFATSVVAKSPQEAEALARQDAESDLLVAGVIEGHHECVDAAYAYSEGAAKEMFV